MKTTMNRLMVFCTLFALLTQACSSLSPQAAVATDLPQSIATATADPTDEFTILYEDDFSDRDSGWPNNEVTGGHTADYKNGSYSIAVTRPRNSTDIPLGPPASIQTNGLPMFTDVRVEVDVLPGANPAIAVGLNCREQLDRINFYTANITKAGEFYISKLENDQWDILNTGYSPEAAAAWGSQVRLRFDCIGSELTLFVNGDRVASASDSAFARGAVGLYAESGGSPSETLFDNFIVMEPKSTASEGESQPLSATAGGGTGVLAYASYQSDDTYQIFTMNADGSNQAQLVPSEPTTATLMAQPRNNYYPEYSPDGSLLTYWNVDKVTFTDAEICCQSAYVLRFLHTDGTTSDLTLPAGDSRTSWSPDGSSIAIAAYAEGAAESDIAIFDLATQHITFLTSAPESDQQPAWSPDGTFILYSHFGPTGPSLYTADIFGINQRPFETGTENASEADWSPDGGQVAFVVYYENSSQIFIINTDGSGLVQLTHTDGYSQSPDWSPDGSLIAYSLDNQIYVMNADGSNPVNISNNDFREETPTWQSLANKHN